jgi:hypothetical protein
VNGKRMARSKNTDCRVDDSTTETLDAGTIEQLLTVNNAEVICRRSTGWLKRSETARFYAHHARKLLPPLKNQVG